nr:pyridoxamine 5'-phosphate oxidase family protein [Salinicola acroporae]
MNREPPSLETPFHAGELEAQRRAGVEGIARSAGSFIRDFMPEQHREFFAQLPFIVMATGDAQGRPWVTLLEGEGGFIETPDARTLAMAAAPDAQDPLASAVMAGVDVGLLGIELATRRRNRLNGVVRSAQERLVVEVQQSFGNCPQYIREREWRRVESVAAPDATVSERLDSGQRARISAADTFFIGSVAGSVHDSDREPSASRGYDASHRGGEPGFVQVTENGTLWIPDYAGNNFFNTLGNLIQDPRVGLLFVDFETGGLLQITGRARIDWSPQQSRDPNAKRWIEVCVEQVVDRPAALTLRWRREDEAPLRLTVVDKVAESDQITSFYLAEPEGERCRHSRPASTWRSSWRCHISRGGSVAVTRSRDRHPTRPIASASSARRGARRRVFCTTGSLSVTPSRHVRRRVSSSCPTG